MKFRNLGLKVVIGLMGTLGYTATGYAEILVILPQSGVMANAADSIKRGLVQANYQHNDKYRFHFVDSQRQSIDTILKMQVKSSTQLVIGPLDKQKVAELLAAKPQIQVLALNAINHHAKNVLQFALAKEEDAMALTKQMQRDGVKKLLVLQEEKSTRATQSFYDSMSVLWKDKMTQTDKIPFLKKGSTGILLLGSNAWMNQLDLPQKAIYTLPYAIEQEKPIPVGMVYCDTPSLYTQTWPDVINAYRQKPVNMSYQRLLAFGGDAWEISDALLQRKNNAKIEFSGRTGKIQIVNDEISRQPICFLSQGMSQKILP